MKSTLTLLCGLHLATMLAGLTLGFYAGRESHQNVNDLIRVGFKVIDPDGYECNQWDEGLFVLFPNYYTNEHKGSDYASNQD